MRHQQADLKCQICNHAWVHICGISGGCQRGEGVEVALVAVALPLHCQNRVARLSVLLKIVRSLVSKDRATTSKCSRPPASSKSEFVIFPSGFAKITKLSVMSFGHWICHKMGAFPVAPRGIK